MSRKGGSIKTFTGLEFWPLDPRPSEIVIEDIAHALSNQCRFSGHTSTFYSVAQHSFLVAEWCGEPDRLWGLLHDAAEAYLVDLPRPLKHLPEFSVYRDAEKRLMACVCERFGLPVEEPATVRMADNALLLAEKRDLMGKKLEWENSTLKWPAGEPVAAQIKPLAPADAELMFLAAYDCYGRNGD